MIIRQTTGLGEEALRITKKYNGFMGVSIPHRFFSKKTMQYYTEWGSHQFEEFIILLMDDPEKSA
jgi:hypothetical protein